MGIQTSTLCFVMSPRLEKLGRGSGTEVKVRLDTPPSKKPMTPTKAAPSLPRFQFVPPE